MGTSQPLVRGTVTVITILLLTMTHETSSALFASEPRPNSHDTDYIPALPIQQFCPYSTFCKRPALMSNLTSNDQPCCLPCSCHERCSMTASCCPDALVQLSLAMKPTPDFPCRDQQAIYETYLGRRFNTDMTNALDYHIVDRCPPEAINNTGLRHSVERCESGRSAKELQDLIFVSGPVSGIVYLNVHCAMCNGEKEFIRWNLYVADESLLRHNFTSQFDRDQYIIQYSNVFCVPPSKSIGETSVCKWHAIHTCNITGDWDVYDPITENACLYGHTSYYFEMRYANVYCYICNNPIGVSVPDLCKGTGFEVSHLGRGIMTSFSALVRFDSMTCEHSPSNSCAHDEVMNPLLNECVRLFCPPGSYSRKSVCEQLTENIIGFGIEIFFDIEIQNNSCIPFDANSLIIEASSSLVRRMTRQKKTKCDKCLVKIFETAANRGLLAAILVSTAQCSHLDLLELIWATLQKRTVEISTYHGRILLKLNESLSGAASIDLGRLLYFASSRASIHTDTFTKELVYCPSVEINIDALYEFDDGGSLLRDVILQPVTNETVRICISDLERISNRNRVGRSGPNTIVLATLLAMTYMYTTV